MRVGSLFALAAIGAGVIPGAAAQVLQPWGDLAPRSVYLDIFRPAFDGGGTTTLTTINQLGVRWALGSIVLEGELPIVMAKAEGAPSGGTLIGNPFLGVATLPTSSFIGELGVRLPIASASTPEKTVAELVGILGDIADFDAYAEDILTIRGTIGYRSLRPDHLALRAALRPTLMSPTGSSTGSSELFLDYGFQLGYETARYTAGAMFNGRAILTESGLSLGERTLHEIGIGGSLIAGQWRPGLILRLPLDKDMSDTMQPSLGLKVEVTF